MFRIKNVKSSIPRNIVEKPVRDFKQDGAHYYDRVMDCFFDGILVGQRVYNREGMMVLETPIQDGLRHGWEFTWDDDGRLLLMEPYVKGKIHGMAEQYGKEGNIIGTYTLVHGTGFDIWRQENEDKTVFVSEIHSLQDGLPHGNEWHFATPNYELWHERSWHMGKLHGIERIWNSKGKLRRGYPRFHVLDQVVSRQKYLKLAQADRTLPTYREEDNLAQRNFPTEIQELMSR
jgi:hypothetical protein